MFSLGVALILMFFRIEKDAPRLVHLNREACGLVAPEDLRMGRAMCVTAHFRLTDGNGTAPGSSLSSA